MSLFYVYYKFNNTRVKLSDSVKRILDVVYSIKLTVKNTKELST